MNYLITGLTFAVLAIAFILAWSKTDRDADERKVWAFLFLGAIVAAVVFTAIGGTNGK